MFSTNFSKICRNFAFLGEEGGAESARADFNLRELP